MEKQTFISNNEQETIDLGSSFANKLKRGDIVALYGDLGTGKTEFIKGICRYFQVQDLVTSPTFTIMNHYFGELDSTPLDIYHLDLYRIKSLDELANIGFADCIYEENSIKLIEWAEKAENILDENANYLIAISQDDENENMRTITINS
jgi:tRNA threonylcarbamoyladenosine biosynthesis protein TsaE